MAAQLGAITLRRDLINDSELQRQSREFLTGVREVVQNGYVADIMAPEWTNVREFLESLSRARARQGFTPSETATFVLSLKEPLFNRLRQEYSQDAEGLGREIWAVTEL